MSVRAVGLALACALALVAAAPAARACIWDRDTLAQERARFPTALELLTGKFIRHTPEFYAWRLRDRQARIAANPDDLALVDDLAVAHDKLGQHAEAIAATQAILPRAPRRYETLANLGTFYLHSGDFERGLEFIDRALEVNPDAHFGRERYQRWLAEYLMTHRDGAAPVQLPLFARAPHGFEVFLADKHGVEQLSLEHTQEAVRGVLGMMRFGKHDSPILCEVLGDLLSAPGFLDGALLAARAYLMAADNTDDRAARAAYRAQADAVLALQIANFGDHRRIPLAELEQALRRERAEADAWYAEFAALEAAWIRDSPDPEAEVARFFAAEPTVTGVAPDTVESPLDFLARHRLLLAILALAGIAGAVLVHRAARPPRAASDDP
jgi:tetratricopeptide (TPR) repeat protein